MKIFAEIDKNGFPIAFYTTEIHDNIPSEAIEISEKDWSEHLSGKTKQWDGEKWVDYKLPINEILDNERQRILLVLHSFLENKIVLPKEKQRILKYNKAKEWQQQNFIPARAPKVIIEEAKIKGIEPQELARMIIQKYEEHERYVEELEIIRQKFKHRIKNAKTLEELEQIENEITNIFNNQ